ncbi:MAG: CarD family transcriptional regulator [Clostridia bacterium]|nr:CarD family transcriptional regulator [Clostridia bacterium]
MFNVGDRVVYPMHGAGIIEAIEEKEILGEIRKYYVMRIANGDMRVMIPLDNVEESGLREVIDEHQVKEVLSVLQDRGEVASPNWNRRYRANLEKIKTGDIMEVAEVVRNLSLREREKGLSTGERKMLDNARQILISELVLAKGIEEEQMEIWLEGALA